MTDFVRGSNPIWYLVDLVGKQFNDTFYMYVLENTIPYLPQAVYHTPTGTPWVNPIQFLANGTLPTDIFFDPTLVYRLEFRQNVGPLPPSQADPLIYLIEDYSPNGDVSIPIDVNGISIENQLANSQFVEMSVNTPYTFTGMNPPDIEVSPGWFLHLVGNGTVDINRIPINSAVAMPTNAPYALEINLGAGWTSLPILYQRLSENGILWANKHVSVSYTAQISGASQNITTRLTNSMGAPIMILGTDTLTNVFAEYTHVAAIPGSTNTDLPPNAYIDFQILLPTVADIFITSLQLTSLNTNVAVSYQQEAVDRQVDHLFHYYKDRLIEKPIPSYLTGWDFPLNPAQFTGSTVAASAIGANKSKYVWDQTIIFQSVDSSIGVTRATGTGDFVLTAAVTGQTAIVQYLDQTQARRLLSDNIATNFAASSTNSGGLVGTVSLWATDDVSLPNVAAGTNNSIVLTLDANGKPATLNGAGWVEVPRSTLGDAKFNLTSTLTEFDFNGWNMSGNALVTTATYFAIVIGFATLTNPGTINFQYVGLCSGDLATRPAPLTPQETLSNCEQYYEKSYTNGSFAGAVTSVNALTKMQASRTLSAGNSNFISTTFSVDYRTIKRSNTPLVAIYTASTGAAANVDATIKSVGAITSSTNSAVVALTQWTIANLGDRTFTYLPNYGINGTPSFAGCGDDFEEIVRGWITFHYVVDARLGIV